MKCKICNHTLFNGTIDRPYRVCTNCGAMERQRALWPIIVENINKKTILNKMNVVFNILEIAPLNKNIFGNTLKNTFSNITYTSADKYRDGNPNDPRDVNFCDKYVDIIDLHKMMDNNYYDIFIMQHVLEEVTEYKQALINIFSILKKNGIALLEIPCESSSNINEFHEANKFGNVWKFSKVELANDLQDVFKNFKIKAIEYEEGNYRGSFFICIK